jgi:hypothetical protein
MKARATLSGIEIEPTAPRSCGEFVPWASGTMRPSYFSIPGRVLSAPVANG